MPVSVLAQFLVSGGRNMRMRMPEKLEASIRSGVSSRPILNEIPVEEDSGPFLVTNAKGQFVPTTRSRIRGVARCAFSEIPEDEESSLLAEMYMSALTASWSNKWRNRCNSIVDAVDMLRRDSLEPTYIIMSAAMVPSVCGPDFTPERVEQLMVAQGHIAAVDGIRVLPADLTPDAALVFATPALVGNYTRVGDFVGVMLQRVDRVMVVVGDGVA